LLEETIRIYLLNSPFKYKQLLWSLEYLEFPLWDHIVFTDEAGFWLEARGWFPKGASTEEIEEAGKGNINV